jgi:hypothetical protein
VSRRDDRRLDLLTEQDVDAVFEALLAGRELDDDWRPLRMFADDLRVVVDGAAPAPSPALAVLLRGAPARRRPERLPRRTAARVAGLGVAAKAGLCAAFAVTGVAAAAAAGVLPEPVVNLARPVIDLVTPWDVGAGKTRDASDSGNRFAPVVSYDGTDPAPAAGDPTAASPGGSAIEAPSTTAAPARVDDAGHETPGQPDAAAPSDASAPASGASEPASSGADGEAHHVPAATHPGQTDQPGGQTGQPGQGQSGAPPQPPSQAQGHPGSPPQPPSEAQGYPGPPPSPPSPTAGQPGPSGPGPGGHDDPGSPGAPGGSPGGPPPPGGPPGGAAGQGADLAT